MTPELPPIPVELLPRPRLIVWHGDVESEEDGRPLEVLRRAFDAVVGHGFTDGRSAGGNDWTGWHLPEPGYVDGLADTAHAVAKPWWRIIHEPGDAKADERTPNERAAKWPVYLTADSWQALSVTLHAAGHFLERFVAGDLPVEHLNTHLVMATMLVDVLGEWEAQVEELRPKTALADVLGVPAEVVEPRPPGWAEPPERPPCATGCGLPAEPGDIYCAGCGSAPDRAGWTP
jgi:hypothetical protein